MKIESARIVSYRGIAVDENAPPEAARRLRVLKEFDELRAAGCAEDAALKQLRVSRRTLYRWKAALADGGLRGLAPKSKRPRTVRKPCWTDRNVRAVLEARREHPFMGKARIRAVLARRGVLLSVSTVGRILARAVAAGHVAPASVCEGRLKAARRRDFDGSWSQRWEYGSKAEQPGELVQIDHMTYSRDGQSLKEFRAVCPVTRLMGTAVFSRATAGNAKRFLLRLVADEEIPLRSVQVDGGSEFMAEFEEACRELGLPLHVLPPRRPQWNGRVERANRSARIEFWNRYDGPLTVEAVSEPLKEYQYFYNYKRPHTALAYKTPSEYRADLEKA